MVIEDFKALLLERPQLGGMIDQVEQTDWGCSYVWDGLLNCHIVFERGQYADVQDVPDGWKPWDETGHGPSSVWTRYGSVLSLVLNMERIITD